MDQKPAPVDLDRYREPARDPQALAARRAVLLDQLGWLADEAAALAPLLTTLPAWALESAPLPGDRSVKGALAHLAFLDRAVYPRWIEQVENEERPELAEPGEEPEAEELGVSAQGLDALVDDLRQARAALVARLEAAPEAAWQTEATLDGSAATLYDLLLRIVRHDADVLRALAYRLHEAKLASRP